MIIPWDSDIPCAECPDCGEYICRVQQAWFDSEWYITGGATRARYLCELGLNITMLFECICGAQWAIRWEE